ncbi:hypothetical protein Dimus_025046 [Dionaea muscipula]
MAKITKDLIFFCLLMVVFYLLGVATMTLASGLASDARESSTPVPTMTFQGKWSECPAICKKGFVENCNTFCHQRGHSRGGECYYPGSGPYKLCCCNTDD